jgi:GTP-binding protein
VSGPRPSTARKTARPPATARLDPAQIVSSSFVAGAASLEALPAPIRAEIAFAGRSNVGKSSLINTLIERRGLVRTSSTPGSTRQINLYEARARDGVVFQLVDLPGYGYTRRSKTEQAAWAELIEGYVRTRVALSVVVLLVDPRRGLEDDDLALIRFVEAAREAERRPVEVIVVATKIDKLQRSASRRVLGSLAAAAKAVGGTGRKVIGFSSVTNEGRRELWLAIRHAVLDAPPQP